MKKPLTISADDVRAITFRPGVCGTCLYCC